MGNYVYFLSEALRRAAGGHELRFHYLGFQSSKIQSVPISFLGNFRQKVRDIPGVYTAYRRVLEFLFRWNTLGRKFDLYHETNYVPFPFRGTTVVTVYDLSFLYFPETHPKERVKFYERFFFPRLNQIDHFVAISQSVKNEMVRDLRVPAGRITVTPLGLDAHYAPLSADRVAPVLAQYGLWPNGYIVSVGTKEPRKNLGRLLEAYAAMPAALRDRFPLVVVGGNGWLVEDWARKLGAWGLTAHVRSLGYVPQEELPALYSGAALLAYPSIYEGFGLPPLEAMGCGCPVLTSKVSSLPEVVGNAACLVDPLNVEDISAALVRLLESPADRDQMRRRGLQQARLFHWDRCAQLTLEAYVRARGGKS